MSPWAAAAGGAIGLAFLAVVSSAWPAPAPLSARTWSGRGRDFFLGAAGGLVAMAAIELASVVLGAAKLAPAPRGPAIAWGAGWALAALLVAGAQEGWVRGWLLARMTARWGFARAASATSLFFVLLHAEPTVLVLPAGMVLLGATALFLFGLAAAGSVRGTGSIAWAVGAHAGWDYIQGFVLGAPAYGRPAAAGALLLVTPGGSRAWLAGAAFGPEASPLAILFLGAAIWAWLRVRPRRGPSH